VKPGPKKLPANVHLLRGNPSKLSVGKLMDDLQPEIELPGLPPHLLPEAKKEYRRIAPELVRYGLISKIDRAALCLYLQSWAELVWAEKALKRRMDHYQKKEAEASERGEFYEGPDGMTEMTSNGNVIYSPYWVIANKARHNVDKFLQNFGMAPSARSRVTPSNHLQGNLFGADEGDDEDQPAGGFGSL